MKVVSLAVLAAVAALPQLAAAAPKERAEAAAPRHAAAAPKSPNAQYGGLQEVYTFCAQVVPSQAAYFKSQANALPAVQHDSEYQRGQNVLTQSLQQLPNSEAVDACRAIGLSAAKTPKNPKPQSRLKRD